MKTLWLLRHAKASAGRPGASDHERPLAGRGRDAARRMGRHLARRGFSPDRVLCSTAVRARETLEQLCEGLGAELEAELDRDLYLAGPDAIAGCLRALSDDNASALVVGHNPGLAELAGRLARRGDPERCAALRRKFPTCALAELRVDVEHWRHVGRGGELAAYWTPKTLED